MNRQNDRFDENDGKKSENKSEQIPIKSDEAAVKGNTSIDVDGYIFSSGKVRRKKRVHTASGASSSDDIVVRSRTKNYAKHKRKHRHSHRKKMKTRTKVLLAVGCSLLGIIVAVASAFAILVYQGSCQLLNSEIHISAPDGVEVEEGGKYVVYNGETYEFNENITNILCMGVDREDIVETDATDIKGTGGQADVLMLLSIDTSTGKMTLVNISRETMTDVALYSAGGSYAGTEKMQICLSYAYGDGKETSCENTVNSVQKLFYNIPINTYFALDLDGISALTDCVGGVDVVSPETIGDFIEGETYHLTDGEAENFVRARNSEVVDSNNNRMQRQKVYLESFMNKVISQTKQDITVPIGLYNASADYSCTDLNPSKVMYLAQMAVLQGVSGIEMQSVPGEVTAGEKYAEFNVDEKSFYEMFLSIYYTKIQ